jgi:hypothetical protein
MKITIKTRWQIIAALCIIAALSVLVMLFELAINE